MNEFNFDHSFSYICSWKNDEDLPNKTLVNSFVFLKECTGENIMKNLGKIWQKSR